MKSEVVHYCVGIDIGKHEHYVNISSQDNLSNRKVIASRKVLPLDKSYKDLGEWIKSKIKVKTAKVSIVMEATGTYYESLFLFLSRLDYKVSVVLPTKIKHFISSHGKHSKNDKNDSAMLSLYGLERHPEVTAIPSDEILGLKSLTRHYQCLQERRTALLNQEEANFHRGYNSELSKTHLEAGLKQLNEQLEEVNKAIKKHINDSADLLANYKLVEPIHGIGYLSFAVFYAESNGFVKIKNVRQLVSYAGYDVIENQSGTRSGKTRISKKGNYRIRRAMHMPALVAIKNKDSIFYNLYERVYEKTKIKMKAYVAVQRKLISIMYSILKKQEVFSNEYVPQKNTPPKKEIQTDLISI